MSIGEGQGCAEGCRNVTSGGLLIGALVRKACLDRRLLARLSNHALDVGEEGLNTEKCR